MVSVVRNKALNYLKISFEPVPIKGGCVGFKRMGNFSYGATNLFMTSYRWQTEVNGRHHLYFTCMELGGGKSWSDSEFVEFPALAKITLSRTERERDWKVTIEKTSTKKR